MQKVPEAPETTPALALISPIGWSKLNVGALTASAPARVAKSVEAIMVIKLLVERRSAQISAAVTGKIDVRGIAEKVEAA